MVYTFPIVMYLRVFFLILNQGASKTKYSGPDKSLADVAMCNTIGADENNIQKVVTVDLNVTFLKGAKGDCLFAHAHAVQEGRNLTHADCLIYDEKDQLIAKAKGVFFNNP